MKRLAFVFALLAVLVPQLALADSGKRTPLPPGSGAMAQTIARLSGIAHVSNYRSVQAALDDSLYGGAQLGAATYALGATGITIASGKELLGVNRNSSILTYTGTGCAVTLDSTDSALLRNIGIRVNSTSSTARGICFKNTTADSKWNRIENVTVFQTHQSTPISGQVGLDFVYSTSPHAMYWNHVQQVTLGTWDKSIRLLGSVSATNGPNANTFVDVMSYQQEHGVSLEAYATENVFLSLFCSGSGYGGTDCIKIGDGTNPTNFNMFYGVTSDQGAGPVTYTVAANAVRNSLFVNSQSSGAGTDGGTGTVIQDALTSTLKELILLSPTLRSPTSTLGIADGAETGINVGGAGNLTSGVVYSLSGSAQHTFKWGGVALFAFNNSPSIYPSTAGTGNVGLQANPWLRFVGRRHELAQQTKVASSTTAIDPSLGGSIRLTLGTNITSLTINAGEAGEIITLEVVQDATGGRTLPASWTNVVFAGGSYTVTSTLSKRDVLQFIYDGTDAKWYERSRAQNL